MKKSMHFHVRTKEDYAGLIAIVLLIAGFLFYLALVAYIILDFMNRKQFIPRDVIVGVPGYKLHKKLWPVLRHQVFVKH